MDPDLTAVLVQLSIALHKSAIYPPRHPLTAAAIDMLIQKLNAVLAQRGTLSLGIARSAVIVDGTPSPSSEIVVKELAQRLYRRRIGGLTLLPGVEAGELGEALTALCRDPEAGEELLQWPHVRLHPPAFDQLQLAEEGGAAREDAKATRLWADLAEWALGRTGGAGAGASESAGNARALAIAINARPYDPKYAEAFTRRLLELGRFMRDAQGAEAQAVRWQLVELLANLSSDTLLNLLRLSPGAERRPELVEEFSRAMPVAAVIELARASADATQQTISHSLLRILAKLATHAEGSATPAAGEADDALRSTVLELMRDWALLDPNPEAYTALLEGLSRTSAQAPVSAARVAGGGDGIEPLRVVQMALEIGAYGPAVTSAVETLVQRRELDPLFQLLGEAPAGDPVAERIWGSLATLDELRRALEPDEPEPDHVEPLLRRLGIRAAEPLLDALLSSQSRTGRRRLLSWLARMGDPIGPLALARLDSPLWYIQRNMLVLLGSIATWPPGFTPRPYLTHEDARVRREALKLALRVPELRDQTIRIGLADPDEQMLRSTLAAALDGCPADALRALERHLEDRTQPADLRALVARVLARTRLPAARDCLVRRVLRRRRLLPWKRLAAKSPDMLAAVAGLARNWPQDPNVKEALRLAAASGDPQVRAAARGQGAEEA